jgi:hypothetical protein
MNSGAQPRESSPRAAGPEGIGANRTRRSAPSPTTDRRKGGAMQNIQEAAASFRREQVRVRRYDPSSARQQR